MSALLLDRALIHVEGNDALSFLQGMTTQDLKPLATLPAGKALYTAFLSPQGKYLYDAMVLPLGDGLLLDVEAKRAGALVAWLTRYRLRADVRYQLLTDHKIFALWKDPASNTTISHPALNKAIVYEDPRCTEMGMRCVATAPPDSLSAFTLDDYHHHRVMHAVPESPNELAAERSFILDWGLDHLHAIDYKKGCYMGQEIVARTTYRSTVRKQPFALQAAVALQTGDTISFSGPSHQNTELCTIHSVRYQDNRSDAIALVRLDAYVQFESCVNDNTSMIALYRNGTPIEQTHKNAMQELPIALAKPAWLRHTNE